MDSGSAHAGWYEFLCSRSGRIRIGHYPVHAWLVWTLGGCDITDLGSHFGEGCAAVLPGILLTVPRTDVAAGRHESVASGPAEMWRCTGMAYKQKKCAILMWLPPGKWTWSQLQHMLKDMVVCSGCSSPKWMQPSEHFVELILILVGCGEGWMVRFLF